VGLPLPALPAASRRYFAFLRRAANAPAMPITLDLLLKRFRASN
jgi:hypothetical protein